MKRFLTVTVIGLCLVSVTGQAQESNPLEEKIYAQLTAFPQEKIHVHTDKAVYVSGEKIWYRAFVVNALLHVPSHACRYISQLVKQASRH
jgi:hypothetical protein